MKRCPDVVRFSLALGLIALPCGVAAQSAPEAEPATPAAESGPATLTAVEAGKLVADWTIVAEGMQGPTTTNLTFKMDGETLAGEISSDVMELTPIGEIRQVGADLVLYYEFYYDGNPVPTVLTLTPKEDGDGYWVGFDFANGAFYMEGTAARKES